MYVRIQFATPIFLIVSWFAGISPAATLTWDGDTSFANGISNSNRNWNSVAVWRPDSGSDNVTWSSATPDDAVLGGATTGLTTITNDSPTTVGSLTYANTSTRTFTMVGADTNSLTVNTLLSKTNGAGVFDLSTVRITGSGAAIVSSGTLRFGNGTNDFSGGVTVNSNGWLQINADSYPNVVGGTILNGALGTGTLTVNGGTIDGKNANRRILNAVHANGDFAINSSGASLTLNGPVDLGGGIRTIAVSSTTKDAVFGAAVTHGAVIKSGVGIMSLTGSSSVSNSFTHGVVVQQGTLELDGASSAQDVVNAVGYWDVTLYEGTTLQGGWRNGIGNNMVLYHTGSNVQVNLINKYGTTFSGVISETNGPVDLAFSLNAVPNSSLETAYILSGTSPNTYSGMTRLTNATVNNTAITLVLDKTSGVDALAGDVMISGTDTGKTSIVRYNIAKDNQIRDTATVTVGDFGTYRMTDASTTPVGRTETIKALVANNPAGAVQFGGNTVGRLSLGADQGSGIGLFVNTNGTLSGTGLVTVAAAPLAVNAGGTLSPGANGVGTLRILATAAATTNVDLNGGSIYHWEISDWTGAAGTGYDQVVVTGSVSIASTAGNPLTADIAGLTLTNFAKALPSVFTLLTASDGISGLTNDNYTVTVSGIPGLTPANFTLRVENGSGAEQKLVLAYKPIIAGFLMLVQ